MNYVFILDAVLHELLKISYLMLFFWGMFIFSQITLEINTFTVISWIEIRPSNLNRQVRLQLLDEMIDPKLLKTMTYIYSENTVLFQQDSDPSHYVPGIKWFLLSPD